MVMLMVVILGKVDEIVLVMLSMVLVVVATMLMVLVVGDVCGCLANVSNYCIGDGDT